MKKLLVAALILLGACAACCSLPLLAPLLAGWLGHIGLQRGPRWLADRTGRADHRCWRRLGSGT